MLASTPLTAFATVVDYEDEPEEQEQCEERSDYPSFYVVVLKEWLVYHSVICIIQQRELSNSLMLQEIGVLIEYQPDKIL